MRLRQSAVDQLATLREVIRTDPLCPVALVEIYRRARSPCTDLRDLRDLRFAEERPLLFAVTRNCVGRLERTNRAAFELHQVHFMRDWDAFFWWLFWVAAFTY